MSSHCWRVGVIGCGYWGPNLIRNFVENPRTEVRVVSDISQQRLEFIQHRHPHVRTLPDASELIASADLDLVVVSTPVSSHFKLAKCALEAGKHVLVTKPMTMNSSEAEELIRIAAKRERMLAVGHTYLFTGAVRKIRELVQSGDLGEMLAVDSTRVNLGLFQHDVNVVWDLGVHDIAILDYVLGHAPVEVEAVGASSLGAAGGEDVAYVVLRYPGGLLAHLTLSWLSPVKVRQMLFGGNRRMLVYNDMENVAKVQVFDCGARLVDADPQTAHQALVEYRRGDVHIPKLDDAEALRREVEYLVGCLDSGKPPTLIDGQAGLSVIRTLEAIDRSLGSSGKFVPVRAQS